MFHTREHFKLHDNVQEQTKDTTFEKLSEQVIQIQKLQYDVPKSRFRETDGMCP